ncbi:hypothetical protein AB4097_11805 [Microvirga sp. 2MCAF35]|uniref:hypothetical protein n=1 Tax=Microvirga sp. 2MCAF35 TaxID=3232987 RepID=UPI003F96538E
MKTTVLFSAFVTAFLLAASHSQAATQRECLKAIELTKRFEQDSRKAHAVYQQERSEISKCAFLSKSRKHLTQAEKTADICQAYEPDLTGEMKTELVAGLKALDSPNNTCNTKSRTDLLAEKRCTDAQKSLRAKNETFQKAVDLHNSDKNNQTLCTLLKVSLEYFSEGEREQRLCEAVVKTGEPSKVPEIQGWIQKIKARQKEFCK